MANKIATPDVIAEANKQLVNAEKRRRELLSVYKNEPKVARYLSPMYEPYFGRVMQITINGISICFAVNGEQQTIPQSFADEIDRRRVKVDNMIKRQNRMSEVSKNIESSPGELKLF